VLCSSGSACSRGEPSHVLMALGRSRQEAEASLRLSLGWATTEYDIDAAIAAIAETVTRLRASAL
jgi:cysteine desulfurase